ncbi:MAG: phosphoribosyltransferase family protein [Sphaerobacter sp.]|nr:phosphoribosyltransferase family protein [Sphaerobacter sp.]
MSPVGPRAWAQWLGRALEATLLPPTCGGCGRRGAWLCPACAAALRPVPGPLCRCGGRSGQSGATCPVCASWPPALGPVRAAFVFEGPLRRSIHRFKYRGEHARGRYLGELLAGCAETTLQGQLPDLLLPIPLHPRRLRERGFNQAQILAEAVARRLDVRIGEGLLRVVDTRAQVGLDFAGRRANMAGAFQCVTPGVAGASVLLIDDVVTTGATMEAAGLALLAAGAQRVRGLALARGV